MRRTLIALLTILCAAPVAAQESDRQMRQRLSWALSQARNAATAQTTAATHLQAAYDAVHARVVADSLADLTPIDPPADTVGHHPAPLTAPVPVVGGTAGRTLLQWGPVDGATSYRVTARQGAVILGDSVVAALELEGAAPPFAVTMCVAALRGAESGPEGCIDWSPSDAPVEPPPVDTVATPPAPDQEWPELPTGFRVVHEIDFEDGSMGALRPKFQDGTRSVGVATLPTSLIDASPLGQRRALVWNVPANHSSGGGVELDLSLPAGTREAFISFWAYISPNWTSHPSGIHKYLYFAGPTPSGGWSGMWYEFTGPRAPYAATVIAQNPGQQGLTGPGSHDRMDADGVIPRGAWHRVSALYRVPQNGSDGRVRMWIDGTLVLSSDRVTGVPYRLTDIVLSGIMGGVGPMRNSAQAWAIDHLIVAVPPT